MQLIRIVGQSRLRLALCTGILLGITACASTKVETVQAYRGGQLPRPEIVLVNDFSVSNDSVRLDRGITARIGRAFDSTSDDAQELETGRKVASTISETLVEEIRKLGIDAIRVDGNTTSAAGNRLIIDGQLLSVDEGNRTRRNLIGFGAGRSSVEAETLVYFNAPGTGLKLLLDFTAESQSGRKPGAVATLGAGAAADHLVQSAVVSTGASIASEKLSANVDAAGERIAKEIARKLSDFFMAQGWTPDGRK